MSVESTKGGNPSPSSTFDEASQKDSTPSAHLAEEPQLQTLPIDRIDPSPHQVREVFDEESLRDLAASMRQVGLLIPILVRPVAERFQIVGGERRLRAAKLLGWTSIRALVQEFSELDAAVGTMVENEQRQDAGPLERARGFKHLKETFNLQQDEVAARVGVSTTVVSRLLSLLKEPAEIQDLLASGTLTPAHVYNLDEIEDKSARIELATQAAEKNWSVSQIKRRAGKGAKGGTSEHGPQETSDSKSSDSLAGGSKTSDSPAGDSRSNDSLAKVAAENLSQVMRWFALLRWLFKWLRAIAVRLIPGRETRVGNLPPPDPVEPPDAVEPPDSKPSDPKAT